MGRLAVGLLAALLVCLSPALSAATVMVEVPLESLVRDADAIVLGTVLRADTRVVLGGGSSEPHTISELAVTRWFKGAGDPGARVLIDEIGGSWQGGGMRIAGVPRYRVGDEVVVFLEKLAGAYRTYAMAQGCFHIRRGIGGVPATVVRNLDGIGFARSDANGMQVHRAADGPAMRLDALVARIEQLMPRAGAQ